MIFCESIGLKSKIQWNWKYGGEQRITPFSNQLDAIYLDFSKAFDCAPHKRLLLKLQNWLGILGNISNGSERKQRAVIWAAKFSWKYVHSWILWGNARPIRFIFFVKNMPNAVHNMKAMFADDTIIFSCVDSAVDHNSLYSYLW